MTGRLAVEAGTFLEALAGSLRSAGTAFNRQDQSQPAAVLWPDESRQWEPLVPLLRQSLPLLTLGAYNPAELTGPAYWLRCVVDGTIVPDGLDGSTPPVIYLPGVSRSDLRAVEECPKPLQPLAELQYRGVTWTHRNGRDWTVIAYLQTAEGGLGIDIKGDHSTRTALLRALPLLSDLPVMELRRNAPLRAGWFDSLFYPDEARSLLQWMNDPAGFKSGRDRDAWEAFCTSCDNKYRFHPEHDGPITAAKHLGQRVTSEWQLVWNRFGENPTAYPNIPDLLRQGRNLKDMPLFHDASSWPQDNEAAEDALRLRLSALLDAQPADARKQLTDLENEHGKRRGWVWARLGQSPLAHAVEHLAALASACESPVKGTAVPEIAAWYADEGHKADLAVINALSAVERSDDVRAVANAIRAVYRPWLEDVSRRYQEAVASGEQHRPSVPDITPGTCVLFCDALRYDIGTLLAREVEQRGLTCESDWTLAALPTVTGTAKPAISPVASSLAAGTDLGTVVAESGRAVTAEVLRDVLTRAGFDVLAPYQTGDPSKPGWAEMGAIDSHGHAEGWKVSHRIESEVRLLADRVAELVDAGWKKVVVVTDHGWIMLPGNLDKVDLPQHLTVHRKGRCARIKELQPVDHQMVPWHWDPSVPIAIAPGVNCFEAGKEYEHGGLSPQECVVPVLTVSAGGPGGPAIEIGKPTWRGLRCNVTVEGASPGHTVDLRRKAGDPASSIANQPQPVRDDGTASLAVIDDDAEGEAILIVVLDDTGTPCAQMSTIVGGP